MTNREMSLGVATFGTVHVTLMWSGPTPLNCRLVGAGMAVRIEGLKVIANTGKTKRLIK